MDLNPEFELGKKLKVKMRLTEICHDAGLRATVTRGTKDAYLPAYYEALRKLMPDHPALAAYEGDAL